MEKECCTCGLIKSTSDFYCDRSNSDGLSRYCKICNHQHFTNIKQEAFQAYGGVVCKNCGEDFFEVLVLDHIDDDGNEHRKKVGNGERIYYDLKRRGWPAGMQVLCCACNHLKQRKPHLLEEYGIKRRNNAPSSNG